MQTFFYSQYISNYFDIYTVDIHLYAPRLSENERTYFVHTRGLTYTPSLLSLVYIINARCEPRFTGYHATSEVTLHIPHPYT